MTSRPIAEHLFTATVPPRLLGGRHRDTGRVVFPMPADTRSYEMMELPSTGRLWSYTVQRFEPKSPPFRAGAEPFQPFAVGYVELIDVVIVEAILVDLPLEELRIGLPVELTIIPMRTDPDGTAVMGYAFRPFEQLS